MRALFSDIEWLRDKEGLPINPETGEKFKRGEDFQGFCFSEYRRRRGQWKPFFCTFEKYKETLNTKKKYNKAFSSRDLGNKFLIRHIVTQLLHDCKKRAAKYGALVSLDFEALVKIIKLGLCQGSEPPLQFVLDKPGSPFSPSLDRIDSSNRNYTTDNVRVVCKGINTARSNFSDVETLKICKALVGFIEKQ